MNEPLTIDNKKKKVNVDTLMLSVRIVPYKPHTLFASSFDLAKKCLIHSGMKNTTQH
jgi:hypothetical protein